MKHNTIKKAKTEFYLTIQIPLHQNFCFLLNNNIEEQKDFIRKLEKIEPENKNELELVYAIIEYTNEKSIMISYIDAFENAIHIKIKFDNIQSQKEFCSYFDI